MANRLYRLGGHIGKGYKPHIKQCRDSNGLILNETPAIMNRWKLCFQDLVGASEM